MADTYRAWLRGSAKWQDIEVIDLRDTDGIGKRLQAAGLTTLGEIDRMEGPDLLEREGIGIGVLRRIRGIIRQCKADERRRRPTTPPLRVRKPREFPG